MTEPDEGSYLGGEGVKIGAPGNWSPVIEYEVIEETREPAGPPPIQWHRMFLSLFAVCSVGGMVTVGAVAWHVLAGIHIHTHPAASSGTGLPPGWAPWTGQAFAYLAIAAIVIVFVNILRSK